MTIYNKEHVSDTERGGNVLVVDDEPEVLATLQRQLRRQFNVITVQDGVEALQILQDRPIDVVLSDQRMPAMSGAQLLASAHEVNPDAVRIILTGYSDQDLIIKAVNEAHIHRYLTKPWQVDEIRRTVTEAVEIARLRRENKRLLEELKAANEQLEQRVRERTQELKASLEETESAILHLHESESRFRVLAENIPVGIILTDAEGRVDYANHFWPRYTGTSIAGLMSGPWYQLIRDDQRLAAQADWEVYLKHKSGEFSRRLHLASGKDEDLMILLRAVALYGATGSCSGFLFSAFDLDIME
jgi:PAS domain S-box-containing protein